MIFRHSASCTGKTASNRSSTQKRCVTISSRMHIRITLLFILNLTERKFLHNFHSKEILLGFKPSHLARLKILKILNKFEVKR